MELRRTRGLLPRVEWRESSSSTNADLRALWEADPGLPHGTLLATADQTAGRGRAGRGWSTPPGTAVAMSLLLRTSGAGRAGTRQDRGLGPGWLPLLAGSAVTAALQPRFAGGGAAPDEAPLRVGVKWPNDVHVRDEADAEAGRPGKKLCGILCELLPDGAVIVGMGVNLLIPEWELPTERATSLLAAGADVGHARSTDGSAGRALVDEVLSDTAESLLALLRLSEERPASARTRVLRDSLTIGSEVRVHLPGGERVDGFARALAEDGSLVVDRATGGRLVVSAGDVEHLR